MDSGYSPQTEAFLTKYVHCDPQFAIITTANYIQKLSLEERKKFSAREFVLDTYDRMKSSFTVSNSNSYNTNTSSLKRKKKPKEATAQFYAETTDGVAAKADMERKNEAFTAQAAADTEDLASGEEKCLERRSTNTVQTQTQPQSGILKNKPRKEQAKPTSSLNVNGKEIVVIDMDESAKQEPDIIVLGERSSELDLADLLGSDWPKTAGDAAAMLNKSAKTQATQDTVSGAVSGSSRIKSSNPLTHLSSSIGSGSSSRKTNDSYTEANKSE